jgi:hypothetical protein
VIGGALRHTTMPVPSTSPHGVYDMLASSSANLIFVMEMLEKAMSRSYYPRVQLCGEGSTPVG